MQLEYEIEAMLAMMIEEDGEGDEEMGELEGMENLFVEEDVGALEV